MKIAWNPKWILGNFSTWEMQVIFKMVAADATDRHMMDKLNVFEQGCDYFLLQLLCLQYPVLNGIF